MSATTLGIVLLIAVACGAVAVYLQRRLPRRAFALWLVNIAWSVLLLVSFRLITGHAAPYFWAPDASSAEPWERLAFPLAAVAVLWPALRMLGARSPGLELWVALGLASLPLLAALPSGASYADVLPGNAMWTLAALLASGANWLAGQRLDATDAERWSLWVFVAQLLTVAGLLMVCYATLAQWCLLLGISLAVLALCNVLVGNGDWTSTLSLSATVLSCSLLTHIRIYSHSTSLPPWLLSLPMLSPVLVCTIDRLFAGKRHSRLRIAVAALSAAVLAVAALAYAIAPVQAS
jgi:hypothetical protein